MTVWTFLEQLEKAKLLRFGRASKNLFFSVQSASAHLLVKSKICLNAEWSQIWIKIFLNQYFFEFKKLVSVTEFQNGFH